MTTPLTDTMVFKDKSGYVLGPGQYTWKGPSNVPVFVFQNCRDMEAMRIDVTCETPCEAVVVIERTKTGPGVIPSTMNGFARWRIQGNDLALRGFWCRSTIDENNEHMEFHANSFAAIANPFIFEGQHSKHHLLTHNVIERFDVGVVSDTAFHWTGGTIAVGVDAFKLQRVGDPVLIESVGIEAVTRVLVTDGPTTASQPVTLSGVRYEADQLDSNGDCILLRHAGPLIVRGCRFGGGNQKIPRIALAGSGVQTAEISGNFFGSYGAYQVCPVRAPKPTNARVEWGTNNFQKDSLDPSNTHVQKTWNPMKYL